ncbi:hypothetical protein BGX38DRAFT_380582 [Terfezia claveryi]|nr:hypothetical protein BGX38DRAFT_380582 [Terfezia claveryi]
MENVIAVVDRTENVELRGEMMERGVMEMIAPDEAPVIEGISPLARSNTVTAIQGATAMQSPPSSKPAKSTKDEEEISSASSSNGASSPTSDRPVTPASPAPESRKRIVIAGLGMVAVAFIEKLLKLDERRNEYSLLVLGEEPHIAYNRVGLTSYFEHREVERLYLNPQSWYDDQHKLGKLNYMLSTTVAGIDPVGKVVTVHSTINVPATPIITKYPVSPIPGDTQPPPW